jgi:hypothetical protein
MSISVNHRWNQGKKIKKANPCKERITQACNNREKGEKNTAGINTLISHFSSAWVPSHVKETKTNQVLYTDKQTKTSNDSC